MIQVRTPTDDRMYNPSRDLAHCFAPVMAVVRDRIGGGAWAYLTTFAKGENVTDTELAQAYKCLCEFVATQMTKQESMVEALERCGFLAVPEPAKAILMAYLGTVIVGMHWQAVRDAAVGSQGPAMTYRDLAVAGEKFAKLMAVPKWRRPLHKLVVRAREAWVALRRK